MQYNKDNVLFTYVCIFPVQCPICEGNSMFHFYYKKIINQIEFKKWNNLKKKNRFTYSPQLNENNNFESNSSITKISGNIMFCIFDVFHRLNITPWIKNLSFSCLFIFNEVCFLVPVKSNIMWWHESLNRKGNHNAYPSVSR